jgi:hypothetical protein
VSKTSVFRTGDARGLGDEGYPRECLAAIGSGGAKAFRSRRVAGPVEPFRLTEEDNHENTIQAVLRTSVWGLAINALAIGIVNGQAEKGSGTMPLHHLHMPSIVIPAKAGI